MPGKILWEHFSTTLLTGIGALHHSCDDEIISEAHVFAEKRTVMQSKHWFKDPIAHWNNIFRRFATGAYAPARGVVFTTSLPIIY
jgi:hypothetical protein